MASSEIKIDGVPFDDLKKHVESCPVCIDLREQMNGRKPLEFEWNHAKLKIVRHAIKTCKHGK